MDILCKKKLSFVKKIGNWVSTCMCHCAFVFPYLLKSWKPVPKTGNAADHYRPISL